MDNTMRQQLDAIFGEDKDARTQAYFALMEATSRPVNWAYEAWNELLAGLRHKDNHVRAISAQVLCNLSTSDPDNRMLQDFEVLLAVTRDERFVTARHTLQNIWKVGLAGEPQRRLLLQGLERRFQECAVEKNCTLIRYDILQGLRNLYDQVRDETIRKHALDWIESEPDVKYRKKYTSLWKKS
jgi:hypothetical protein